LTSTLKAWEVWREAVNAYKKLDAEESPGALPDWRLYWISAVVLLRTTGHVLDKVDATKSPILQSIISDFWRQLKASKEPIFWEFIDAERNNIVKTFTSGTKPARGTLSSWGDRHLTYEQRVAKHGEWVAIDWNDEDGLRLIAIALQWWEDKLRLIEQATVDQVAAPFSMRLGERNDLLHKSYNELAPIFDTKRL
jgi:hypothetical protein